jgi:alkylhydroperoxidase family enzyme
VPRLSEPDASAIPADITRVLADLPPDPMFRMLSHSATTIPPLLNLARTLYTELELPDRLRELAILTLADATDASFVWTQHVPISATVGIDDEARRSIQNHTLDSPGLSEADKSVLRFSSSVAAGPAITDECFAALREHLSDRQIVELLQVLGHYWMLGRISTVLDVKPTELYDSYRRRFLDR